MSSAQNLPSPRPSRPKHQHSKSANQVQPANGQTTPRRPKGNRRNNANNVGAQYPNNRTGSPAKNSLAVQETDSAVMSSEEMQLPTGPRPPKKHTHSQPSTDRVFSPTSIPQASLTDSELGPNDPTATPAKAHGAYAGPTFHASPAPSALPIPKFLSRSVPAKTMARPASPPEEASDSASPNSPSPPSPSRAPIAVPTRSHESPLDLLFKAHREEKARIGSSPESAQVSHSPVRPSINARQISPPVASPGGQRSITAPSRLPLLDKVLTPDNDVDPIQQLFGRLSQRNTGNSTPPRSVDRAPSEPSSRYHTPSPSAIRNASGPSTPAPPAQELSDVVYGNRNLTPLFKGTKNDPTMRNSGLRTEITADSPLMPQGAFAQPPFPPINAPPSAPKNMDPNTVSRNYLGNVFGPVSPRRGSAPHVQPFPDGSNNRNMRGMNRRSYHARPDNYFNTNFKAGPNGKQSAPEPASTANLFIPSSVQAKSSKPKKAAAPAKPADSLAVQQEDTSDLAQNLKRLLNVGGGDTTGV
ncbi:hypothetical protein P154DRAFT_240857 [Amniculicola lignicola CBS 123094]|uniref:Proteophosphoglycan 5 n=1 Tax=Amniculicola lignicola CBS 123094 TaxID=1392246 RepID=A0A6A5WB40_9PLEO|nr:hypothetical protein P154DRAFT_240857 [Amniculicola lignicola CBS 123094]